MASWKQQRICQHTHTQSCTNSLCCPLPLSVSPALIFLTASLHISSPLLQFGPNPLSLGCVLKDLRRDKKNFTGALGSDPLFVNTNKKKEKKRKNKRMRKKTILLYSENRELKTLQQYLTETYTHKKRSRCVCGLYS